VGYVVWRERFFPARLAGQLQEIPGFKERFKRAVPVAMLQGALRYQPVGLEGERAALAIGEVQVIACDKQFWEVAGFGESVVALGPREVYLNYGLAKKVQELCGNQLEVQQGDRVILRLPKRGRIPLESLFAEKRESWVTLSFTIKGILPRGGLPDFTLRWQQAAPLTVFMSLEALEWLDLKDQCNTLLITVGDGNSAGDEKTQWILKNFLLEPKVAGLDVRETPRGYFLISSENYFIPPLLEGVIIEKLAGLRWQPIVTYLANQIRFNKRVVPYSMITALEPEEQPPLGPLRKLDGSVLRQIPAGGIVLNEWTAEDLGVQRGDVVTVQYFEPEGEAGRHRTREVELVVADIVQLAEAAADPFFTPQIPGVTEKESLRDWEAPFEPFHPEWIRTSGPPGPGNDEDYWQKHGTTPKGFISLETGRKLWANRFGQTTGFRVAPAPGLTCEVLQQRLQLPPDLAGFRVEALRAQALESAEGSTDFAQLFVGFSFFVCTAGLLLAVLFMSLSLAERSREIGILMAIGFAPGRLRALYVREYGFGVLGATGAGVLAGMAYSQGLITLLHTWWRPAVGEVILRWEVNAWTLLLGFGLGLAISASTGLWVLRQFGGRNPAALLSGSSEPQSTVGTATTIRRLLRGIGFFVFAAGAASLSVGTSANQSAERQALWFFTSAVCFLAGTWIFTWGYLRGARNRSSVLAKAPFWGLVLLNLRRNPGRTLATGLIFSLAIFLLVSVSVFRLEPERFLPGQDPGTGGFALVVETSLPVLANLQDPQARGDWLAAQAAADRDALEHLAASTEIISLRVIGGDDASCLNLYRVRQPQILGVPEVFIDRGQFQLRPWVACSPEEEKNPWLLLRRRLVPREEGVPIEPAIVDEATALYALGLAPGRRQVLRISDSAGKPLDLMVIAVLQNSIFQGAVLIREAAVLQHWAEVAGYRFFLVAVSHTQQTGSREFLDKLAAVRRLMEAAFVDFGARVETTSARLSRFAAVQNTYLSAFQSLGTLGLLLGGIGAEAVQLRNVLERRRELALMQAVGFRKGTLARLLLGESLVVVFLGLLGGIVPALVVVIPHVFSGRATFPITWLTLSVGVTLSAGLLGSGIGMFALFRIPFLNALRRE
jgi:ABC-type lipoprotein release transport system permease subunit